MPSKVSAHKLIRPTDRLGRFINSETSLCIIGYGLNAEIGMPHFHDVLQGVWSHEDAILNPFNSNENYLRIMNWFDCRKAQIHMNSNSAVYQVLRELKAAMRLVIATKCADGVASLNDIVVEHELYGNVFQKKCRSCGNEDISISVTEDISGTVCPICGEKYFPNISMFGWNKREVPQSELNKKLAMAECVLLLGVKESLFPFATSARHRMTFLYVEKDQIRIVIAEQQQILSIKDLAICMKEMKIESDLVDRLAKSEEKGGVRKNAKTSSLICRS